MTKRKEVWMGCLLLFTGFLLGASVVLATIGMWCWPLAAVYAASNAGMTQLAFYGERWQKKLLLFATVEACQFILCAIPLGIRAMF